MSKPIRVVFFGDSITKAGALPNGYITRLREALARRKLDQKFELIDAGAGGDQVYDLYFRIDKDVLAKKPDEVIIWIGINDVWHKAWGTGTDPEKFEKFYSSMIKKLENNHINIVLCTPSLIGEKTDFTNQQDSDLNRYSQIIRGLADQHGCELIDWRKIFHEYDLKNNLQNKEYGILTTDKVHLSDAGNQLVADKMLDFFSLQRP